MNFESAWRAARVAVRRGERRATAAACWTLLASMAGHALMETARDALFLESLPASRLPWVYVLIAACALVLLTVHERVLGPGRAGRAGLALLLVGAALGTLALSYLISPRAQWSLYALYTWSGTLASLVLVSFWTHVDGLFNIRQARRILPIIALAGIVGATCGSALARTLARAHGAGVLVPAAAACFAVAALGPMTALGIARTSSVAAPGSLDLDSWKLLAKERYLRLVAGLIVVATITFTLVDFLFKSTAAREIEPAKLASFFATTYLAVNALSLVAQLALSRRLIGRVGPSRTLALLPVLFVAGSGVVGVGAALAGALLSKIADGALRHSVHRTALEMVQVPVPEALRSRTKAVLDVAGQRLSQAVASLGLLSMGAIALRPAVLAALIATASAAWIALAGILDGRYVRLLRDHVPMSRRAVRVARRSQVLLDVSIAELVQRLQWRRTREAARDALVANGDAALLALTVALDDAGTPWRLRRHVPRSISRFAPERAAIILTGRLAGELDGIVRYEVLRALGALRAADPGLRIDHAELERALWREAIRARTLVGWRLSLVASAIRGPALASPDHALLVELMRTEERNTLERAFRLVGLLHPSEDVRAMHWGLRGDPEARADATELLDRLLGSRERRVLLPLLDDLSDGDRAALAGAEVRDGDVEKVLREILQTGGTWLPALAARVAASMGAVELLDDVTRLAGTAQPLQRQLALEAVALLDARVNEASRA